MAFAVADRVKETTSTTGTGTLSLGGASAGFQTFVAGVGSGNTTYYAIIDDTNDAWEVGVGTVTDATPDTLSRDTILDSSNSGSAVDFQAGTKNVFVTQPADKAVYKDSGSATVTVDKLQLVNQSSHPSYSQGLLWYDTIHNTLNYYGDEADLVHEVGLEEQQKVYNNSGSTINKGQPLYFSGNFGGYPTVGLADATSSTAYNAQGLAAHDIEDSSYGYMTTSGLVEDIDTSGLTAGQNYFVSLTPGTVQNDSPTYPNYPMCLGWVISSDASAGKLLVNQQNHSVNSFRVKTDTHIGGSMIIDGDLTVVGSQTIASSTNVETGAPFLYLNSGDSIGSANTTFTGSGLDDAYLAGHFSGTASTTYYVKIDATGTPDTFSWSKDNFSTTEATGVSITGGDQTLDNGIKINFGATTGHTLNDVWSGTATPVDADTGFWSNRNTGGSGVGYTHVGLFFDVTDSKFKLVDEYDPEPTGTINTGDASYSAADLVINNLTAGAGAFSGAVSGTTGTFSSSGSFAGVLTLSSGANSEGNISLYDSDRLRFGNSQDLQIYHAPSGADNISHIVHTGAYTDGELRISANRLMLTNQDQTDFYIDMQDGSGPWLYYNGSERLKINSTGAEVIGKTTTTTIKPNQASISATTASTTIDLSTATHFVVTLTTNTTFSLSNVSSYIGSSGNIIIKEDGTGGHSFTLATEMKTPVNGATIVQSTGANEISVLSYHVLDASTVLVNYIGDFA